MRYYIPTVLEEAYSLSKDAIMYRIRKGILKAIKIPMSEKSSHHFFYAIPASELPKIEKFKLREPEFRKKHQPDYWQEYFSKKHEEEKALEEYNRLQRERRLRYQSYDDYMQSEDWQKKRLQRLKIDDFQCQRCGTAKNLQVHHITYRHFRDEPMEDLITLCDNCHREIHKHDFNAFADGEDIDKDLGVDIEAEKAKEISHLSRVNPETLKALFPTIYKELHGDKIQPQKDDDEITMLLERLNPANKN